jgi:hypothetical protein
VGVRVREEPWTVNGSLWLTSASSFFRFFSSFFGFSCSQDPVWRGCRFCLCEIEENFEVGSPLRGLVMMHMRGSVDSKP